MYSVPPPRPSLLDLVCQRIDGNVSSVARLSSAWTTQRRRERRGAVITLCWWPRKGDGAGRRPIGLAAFGTSRDLSGAALTLSKFSVTSARLSRSARLSSRDFRSFFPRGTPVVITSLTAGQRALFRSRFRYRGFDKNILNLFSAKQLEEMGERMEVYLRFDYSAFFNFSQIAQTLF